MQFTLFSVLANLFGHKHHHNVQPFLNDQTNSRPMIGLLSQPLLPDQLADPKFDGYTSYIMQNYAQWIE